MTTKEQVASIEAMESNMKAKLKYVAAQVESMEAAELLGVSLVDSRLPSDTFNTAFGGEIQAESARQVFEYYSKNQQPMAWWIGPSSESEMASTHLEAAGFAHDELDIGMSCDLTQPLPEYTPPQRLEISQCRSAQEFADFAAVLASIFDPVDTQVPVFYEKMAELDADETSDMLLFVGYDNGRAVATSCLFLTDVAGIFDISARPEERKKGYGSAMFHRALVEAMDRGFKMSVLQASPDGLGIYKRFGFKEECEFNVWSNVEGLSK